MGYCGRNPAPVDVLSHCSPIINTGTIMGSFYYNNTNTGTKIYPIITGKTKGRCYFSTSNNKYGLH